MLSVKHRSRAGSVSSSVLCSVHTGYLADLNGSRLDDELEFRWDFETSLNGNSPPIHATVLSD